MKKTFSSFSFGCRVNHAEREEIDRQMIAKGFTQTQDNPSIFIINTCSVTHKAEREARQLVYKTKRENPDVQLVVTGCSATYWLKTGSYKSLPIDLLVDNTNKEYLVSLLQNKLNKTNRTIKNIDAVPATDKFLSTGRLVVKIQDGCHRFCSFCIVPYLRGLPKSTQIFNIVKTINSIQSPLSEVILTAINTEAYGKDTNESFLDLIKGVLSNTTIARVSFGSVHPWSITDEFIDFYKDNAEKQRLVKFFHIPLQSGSNRVLSLMKRCHTREDMMERVSRIYSIDATTFISTDIIVGYLEETDEDFSDTYDFLDKSPIHKFHVFRFSKRSMTAAYYLSKRLKEPTNKQKKDRSMALRKLSEKKFQKFKKSLIGYNSKALCLPKNDSLQECLLDNQISVFVHKNFASAGSMVSVSVDDYKKGVLFGKIV